MEYFKVELFVWLLCWSFALRELRKSPRCPKWLRPPKQREKPPAKGRPNMVGVVALLAIGLIALVFYLIP